MKHRTIKDIVARMRAAEQYTIFVLGDSITEGARASDAAHTYTAVFTKGLAERFPDRRVIRYDGLRRPVKEAELLPLLGYSAPIPVQKWRGWHADCHPLRHRRQLGAAPARSQG